MLVGWLGAEGIKLNVEKLITVLAKVSMPLASYSFVMCFLLLLTFFCIFSLLWYLLG